MDEEIVDGNAMIAMFLAEFGSALIENPTDFEHERGTHLTLIALLEVFDNDPPLPPITGTERKYVDELKMRVEEVIRRMWED